MQKRYRHYMAPLERKRGPLVVLCIEVKSTVADDELGSGRRVETFDSAVTTRLTRKDGRYVKFGECHSMSVDSFWTGLLLEALHNKSLQLVSFGCTRVWSLLKLWEGIEDGKIQISEEEDERPADSTERVCGMRSDVQRAGRQRANAYLSRVQVETPTGIIAEDPPNIARFRLAGSDCRIVWWDVRNWGVDAAELGDRGARQTFSVDAWYADISSAFASRGICPPLCTGATWALSAYRQQYYAGGIYMHTHEQATQLEADAYYGGRCECFRMGPVAGKCYMLDIKSAYLHACVESLVPVRLLSYNDYSYIVTPKTWIPPSNAIARVFVETDTPCLPYRRDGDIVYPVGRFWTSLCGPELRMASDMGVIRKVSVMACYDMEHALRHWGQTCWELRYEAERAGMKDVATAIKRAGVSIIGKLAQRKRGWERVSKLDGAKRYGTAYGQNNGGEMFRLRYIGGRCWKAIDEGWANEANVAMAAWITSANRVYLWGLLASAGLQHRLYCDTDCVMVDDAGRANLSPLLESSKGQLGSLDTRYTGDSADIYGIKHYRIGDRHVCAGMPHGMYTDCGDGRHHWYTPAAGQQASDGRRPSADSSRIDLSRCGSYRHGIVCDDGTVLPLRIEEPE